MLIAKRIICWFSCGAASAVAAKLTLEKYGVFNFVQVICCDTRASEHPDNYRFSREVEEWLDAQIELPTMYKLGFKNNNCPGCVKATSPRYWNWVRRHFPEVFERRARQSRALGVRLVAYPDYNHRMFLDELPPDLLAGGLENVSCGPECGQG